MSAPPPSSGPRRAGTPVSILVLALAGLGSFVAAGAAAERGQVTRKAVEVSPGTGEGVVLHPGTAAPDTGTVAPPAPWAIPRLEPARVQVPRPSTPADGEDPPPPLVRLALAEAPIAPGTPGLSPAVPALPPPTPLSAREVEAILAPLPALPRSGPGPSAGGEDDAAGPEAARGAAPGPGSGADRGPDRGAVRGTAAAEPARVLGVFPSGDAEVVPDLTIVFSHPVVPLGAVGEATSVPFRLEPEVAGSWHWLDATTARFVPREGRLPGGQAYHLTVDPGLGGPTGEGLSVPLPHEARIRVRGPLALGGVGQGSVLPTTPVLVLGFDQAVDPAVVASHTLFRVLGRSGASESSQVVRAVARTLDEAPEGYREAVRSGRYAGAVALSPEHPLPPGARVLLEVGPDLTSTEGPLTTGRRQELTFRTADAFRFLHAPCNAEATCSPGTPPVIGFSNPVDPSQPLGERIRVSPEVPGLQIRSSNTGHLWLHGPFQPWTSYRIGFDGDLVDVFGSALGETREVTLHFGRTTPLLSIRGAPFVSLDPSGSRTLEVPVRALDLVEVRILATDPERWDEWIPVGASFRHDPLDRAEGLRELERYDVVPDDGGDGFSFLHLPLARALEAAGGQVAVVLTGYQGPIDPADGDRGPPSVVAGSWVQVPSLRVQLLSDAERLVVVARTLDGAPAADVHLALPHAGVEAVTGPEGMASIPLPFEAERASRLLVAEHGGHLTLVPSAARGRPFPQWMGREGAPEPVWAATVDRPLYRPGEPLAFQGWVQEVVVQGEARDVRAPERIRTLGYEIVVPSGGGGGTRTVHSGELEVSPTGGFHGMVDLPDDLEPGNGRVRLVARGVDASGDSLSGHGLTLDLNFRTADFRRPDYEVTVSLPPEVLVQDEPFHVTAEARYFDGPGLPGSELRWSLLPQQGSYAPPGWRNPVSPLNSGTGPASGARHPWGFASAARSPLAWTPGRSSMEPVVHVASTDPEGRHRLEVTPSAHQDPFPLALRASVTVQDLNRQAGSATGTALLLPGEALPGIRVLPLTSTPSGRLVVGDSVEVEVVVLDAEGAVVPADRRARPEVQVERVVMNSDPGRRAPRWIVDLTSPVTCRPSSVPTPLGSPHGPTVEGYRCRAPLPEAGEWLVSVEVADARGRRSRSEANLSVFAPGASSWGWMGQGRGLAGFGVPGISGEALEVELEGDDASGGNVLPGDTVTLRILAPFEGGLGVAALDHGGIRRILPVEVAPGDAEHRIRFPVEGAPGARVVEVLLESPGGDRGASGRVAFEVGPDSRRLALEVVAPEERLEPGATVPVAVTVTEEDGAPVPGAEVTIWLVDEAAFFAGGAGGQAFTTERLDPWASFHQGGGGIQTRGGVWLHTLRERRPPGEGAFQVRLLDASTGGVPTGTLELTGSDGVTRTFRPDQHGEVHLADLPPGDLRVRFLFGSHEVDLDRTVTRKGGEGVDLGTLLLQPRAPPQTEVGAAPQVALRASAPDDLPPPRLGFTVEGAESRTRDIEVPAPPGDLHGLDLPPEVSLDPGGLRADFTPLAGMAPREVTDQDGVARTTFRLPHTLTRYRILAVARSGEVEGPSSGAGEGQVVVGRDLVVRATPPRFLRAGDQGEVSILVANGGDVDREVEVALRASGLTLEGTGGMRLHLPAGARREVRIPARASLPGTAGLQARAVSGTTSDAVAMQVAVEIPAAPERMAHRALLEPGVAHTVMLEPRTPVSPGWGGLEVIVGSSLAGGLSGDLMALSETTLPWAGLRIARVRGAAALAQAMERDPSMGASLDSAALARLNRAVTEDMAALGQALRRVRTGAGSISELTTAARAMGSWSVHAVLEASQALEEAGRAGLLPPQANGSPPAPIDPHVLRALLGDLARAPSPTRSLPDPVVVSTLDLAVLWTLHRSGQGLTALSPQARQAVTDLDTEAMRPLWLARLAAMAARAEEDRGGRTVPVGTHRRFLEALENRAMITPGGVTFRRGAPLPGAAAAGVDDAFHFSASSPGEDAEVLLALVEVAPHHPLLPGLVASVAGPDPGAEGGSADGGGSRASWWGPDAVGRALPAVEAWAQVHAGGPVNATVALALAAIPAPGPEGDAPLRVRSGEPSPLRTLSMASLLETQAAAEDGPAGVDAERTTGALLSLPLSIESIAAVEARESGGSPAGRAPEPGALSARVLLTWTASDPFQPAMMRGFVVRRIYEAVDDADDVRRDADGTWRIRAGARVRVIHELLLPESRMDVRFEDPFPAGFEPVQGTAGNEGAGLVPGAPTAQVLVDGRWGLTGGTGLLLAIDGLRWYRELRFGRDQVTAWAPALPPGTYQGSWVARATLPGDYIVPGARAHEASRPDVMGRSEAHRVVVEAR